MTEESPREKSIYTGMYSVAQFQAQVAIAILPLGAAAVGFIAQQRYTPAVGITLALLWLGLLIVAVSVFLNLQVIRTDPNTSAGRDRFDWNFNGALASFVLGSLFLIVSPVGFIVNQMITPPRLVLKASTETIKLNIPVDVPVTTTVLIMLQDVPLDEFPFLRMEANVSSSACLAVAQNGEQDPKADHDTWLTIWSISASTQCEPGDYAVLFKAWGENQLRGQTQVYIKITP